MPKFIVTRQVIYAESIEIEAESEDKAVEEARCILSGWENRQFLDYDYYEVLDEVKEETQEE